jgi:hypothetical protein
MSTVFVIISEQQPVNGTYPASSNESFWTNEHDAWTELDRIAWQNGYVLPAHDDVFVLENDPEKYEYIEYRIEEHKIKGAKV